MGGTLKIFWEGELQKNYPENLMVMSKISWCVEVLMTYGIRYKNMNLSLKLRPYNNALSHRHPHWKLERHHFAGA